MLKRTRHWSGDLWLLVDEPGEEDTIAILRGLKERYEVHHSVDITDSAIIASAKLSSDTSPTVSWPDKAIDLVDEAASASDGNRFEARVDGPIERRLIQLKIEREAVKRRFRCRIKELASLDEQIDAIAREYADLVWSAEKAAVQA